MAIAAFVLGLITFILLVNSLVLPLAVEGFSWLLSAVFLGIVTLTGGLLMYLLRRIRHDLKHPTIHVLHPVLGLRRANEVVPLCPPDCLRVSNQLDLTDGLHGGFVRVVSLHGASFRLEVLRTTDSESARSLCAAMETVLRQLS
jgi:hypothetical protein